jgi:hypothetical protein
MVSRANALVDPFRLASSDSKYGQTKQRPEYTIACILQLLSEAPVNTVGSGLF